MRKFLHALIPVLVIIAVIFAYLSIDRVYAYVVRRIGVGTPNATSVYIMNSGNPGPTVMVTGSIHGNEPAGSKAAWNFTAMPIKLGKLIVVPELNPYGLRKNSRYDYYKVDLNRAFPRKKGEAADTKYSKEVWDLVKEFNPDYMIDLHEGYSYHKIDSSSVGQSIISSPNAKWLRDIMVSEVNKSISVSSHQFSKLTYPVPGSLARAGYEVYGKQTMIIETCNKQPLSTRAKQHTTMVLKALVTLKML